MCDRASIVCLKRPHDFKGRGKDPDDAIIAAQEETVGSRADAADLVAFEEGSALIVGGIDLADLEEIKRFPLYMYMTRLAGCSSGRGRWIWKVWMRARCSSPKLMP